MKMTIDLKNFSTYVSSGRVSNIFKLLNLKDIKFEEEKLFSIKKCNKNTDLLEYKHIIDYAKIKTEELYNKRNYEHKYYISNIIDKQLTISINQLNIDISFYFNTALQQKCDIVENKLIKEKLLKLKKLKSMNT